MHIHRQYCKLSDAIDPGSLINYQPKLTTNQTAAAPLSSTNNISTIDLTNYSATILYHILHQTVFTASSP